MVGNFPESVKHLLHQNISDMIYMNCSSCPSCISVNNTKLVSSVSYVTMKRRLQQTGKLMVSGETKIRDDSGAWCLKCSYNWVQLLRKTRWMFHTQEAGLQRLSKGMKGKKADVMTHLSSFLLHIFVVSIPCHQYMHFSQINHVVS